MSVEIIAEIGSCHEGQLDTAIELVGTAVEAGASVVKAQYWSSTPRMVARRRAPELADAYERYRTPAEWLPILAKATRALGAKFGCSVYLPEDVDLVALDADVLKVSSFEASEPSLLAALRAPLRDGKEIVISLGMGTSRVNAQKFLLSLLPGDDIGVHEGLASRVRYLYCVSAYPAPLEQLYLGELESPKFSDACPSYDGFSDHSAGLNTFTGALAVARGATVLERHVRLEKTPVDNPDYPHSMDPFDFRTYCLLAQQAAVVCAKRPSATVPCEEPLLGYRVR